MVNFEEYVYSELQRIHAKISDAEKCQASYVRSQALLLLCFGLFLTIFISMKVILLWSVFLYTQKLVLCGKKEKWGEGEPSKRGNKTIFWKLLDLGVGGATFFALFIQAWHEAPFMYKVILLGISLPFYIRKKTHEKLVLQKCINSSHLFHIFSVFLLFSSLFSTSRTCF